MAFVKIQWIVVCILNLFVCYTSIIISEIILYVSHERLDGLFTVTLGRRSTRVSFFIPTFIAIFLELQKKCLLCSSVETSVSISFKEACRYMPHGSYQKGPVGLLGTRALCPYCFDCRKQPSFSLHHLPWVPVGRFKQLLTREGRGCETREKQTQEQSWGTVLFPHQWIHTTISLSYSADTETPSRWEKLTWLMMVYCPQACRPQISWPEG